LHWEPLRRATKKPPHCAGHGIPTAHWLGRRPAGSSWTSCRRLTLTAATWPIQILAVRMINGGIRPERNLNVSTRMEKMQTSGQLLTELVLLVADVPSRSWRYLHRPTSLRTVTLIQNLLRINYWVSRRNYTTLCVCRTTTYDDDNDMTLFPTMPHPL
jgi:hypothetical protein